MIRLNETSKILNQDEKVIWQGRPQFRPFVASSAGAIIFGLFPSSIVGIFVYTFIKQGIPWYFWLFLTPFILICLYLLVGVTIYTLLVYKYIWYTITDKRVIFQKGLIGRDFDFADFDKVESATVNVGVIDKLFGKNSGSIRIYANRLVSESGNQGTTSTANVPFTMSHITDPYSIFEMFKKVSFDVKTDINFPNVMRPKENLGYQTDYKKKQSD